MSKNSKQTMETLTNQWLLLTNQLQLIKLLGNLIDRLAKPIDIQSECLFTATMVHVYSVNSWLLHDKCWEVVLDFENTKCT